MGCKLLKWIEKWGKLQEKDKLSKLTSKNNDNNKKFIVGTHNYSEIFTSRFGFATD
jgi:hypothetical protein